MSALLDDGNIVILLVFAGRPGGVENSDAGKLDGRFRVHNLVVQRALHADVAEADAFNVFRDAGDDVVRLHVGDHALNPAGVSGRIGGLDRRHYAAPFWLEPIHADVR